MKTFFTTSIRYLFLLAFFTLSPTIAKAEQAYLTASSENCYMDISFEGQVLLEACSTGGSGFTKITNNTGHKVRVCWSLEFNNGGVDNTNCRQFDPHETAKSSCYSCGLETPAGGLTDADIYKYEILD